tara:strand:- start:2175 stop:2579 length:405 start_codon:yes stop_codon:yes gene_type:complete
MDTFDISIADVKHCWHWVGPMVFDLLKETGQKTETAEVYHLLRSGEAMLVVAPEGFVILTIQTEDDESRGLLIWMAKAYKQGDDCVGKYIDFFKDLAHKQECVRLVTRTAIPEVGEHLSEHGWKTMETEYQLKV